MAMVAISYGVRDRLPDELPAQDGPATALASHELCVVRSLPLARAICQSFGTVFG